ncbi:MAG: hypothetical protein PQJ61_09985 [Spirochaetales bacterium]|uniref:Membrane protein YjdF n=1 Tax=Candidatus Thalassospirochaeta sargassi TaxID=3119039 RepID=A0AAJ1IFU3_9SPIO|nr:hypothetical protein [Spirochaetales bacterium]
MAEKRLRLWDREFLSKGDVILAFILRGLFLVSLVISIVTGRYDLIPISAVSFGLTFLPSILERSIKVSLPPSFQVMLLIFIFGAQFLGEILDYYERFWWWDLLLHGWSGVLLGTVGFLLVYVMNEASKVEVDMSPFFISFFALCFAVTCGVVWEVFEYLMDVIFGTNMQKSGLVDTMGDLIIDAAGALIMSVNGFLTLRARKNNVLSRSITRFMEKNPDMEKKHG